MKKINILLPFCCLFVLSLNSCGQTSDYNSSVKIIIESNNSTASTYRPDDVTLTMNLHEFEQYQYFNFQRLPSIGDVNLLIIPILIPGYETIDLNNDGIDDKQDVRKDIELAFFGEDEKLGYESVKTFYQKSSYGMLNLSGEVTDWYDAKTLSGITSANEITATKTVELVNDTVKWAQDTLKIDMKKYDADQDGYIDGVWCIYSSPNMYNGGPYLDDQNYWAYTSWGNQTLEGDVSAPIYNLFGWASYDFMYDGYGIDKVDAHTYIHETGHFLGLSDYYAPDSLTYSPLGRIDMMDANLIDHNSYSKMILGWSKPYIVYGNDTIDLKSFQNQNSFIVVPSDQAKASNEFNPFSEYILIELYDNHGLNYHDSMVYLGDYKILAPQGMGVRIYHVDKRPFLLDLSNLNDIKMIPYQGQELQPYQYLELPITNSRDTDVYNYYFNLSIEINLLDEIRMIEANGVDTFSSGGRQKISSYFKQGDIFNFNDFKDFFIYGTMNNGDTFSKTITIGEMKND